MEKITGKSISGMVTIGPLRVFRHKEFSVEESKVDRPETEVAGSILPEIQPLPK